MLGTTAYYFLRMCAALSPATPAHTCSTPYPTATAITLDSMDSPPVSVTLILLGSPVV
jgi:hypothetical protein